MTSSKQTAALALTGAVALASGAYALGSQAADGDAVAAKTPQTATAPPGRPGHWGRGGPASLSALADRLGVDAAALRSALQDIRPQLPDRDKLRDDFAQELADALNIDVAKVTAAFDKLKPARERHHDLAAALANKLGLSTSKVQDALDASRDKGPAALADALGVSPRSSARRSPASASATSATSAGRRPPRWPRPSASRRPSSARPSTSSRRPTRRNTRSAATRSRRRSPSG